MRAETDMNVVCTGDGNFVEVQGTAEGHPFDRALLNQLLDLAVAGCAELTVLQRNEQLLPREDKDVADEVAAILGRDGIDVALGVEALGITRTADGLRVAYHARDDGCAAVLGMEGAEATTMLQIAMMGGFHYSVLRDGVLWHPTLAEALNNLFTAMERAS